MVAVCIFGLVIAGSIALVVGLSCPVCHNHNHQNVCADQLQLCRPDELCGIHVDHGFIKNTGCEHRDRCQHDHFHEPCQNGVNSLRKCSHCCQTTNCSLAFIGTAAQNIATNQVSGPVRCPECRDVMSSSQCQHDHIRYCKTGEVCILDYRDGKMTTNCHQPAECLKRFTQMPYCPEQNHLPNYHCFSCCNNDACATKDIGKIDAGTGAATSNNGGLLCHKCNDVADTSQCVATHCPSGTECLFHFENGRVRSKCGSPQDCSTELHHAPMCDSTTSTFPTTTCFSCCRDSYCVTRMHQKLLSKTPPPTIPSTTVSTAGLASTAVPTAASTAGLLFMGSSISPGMLCPVCNHKRTTAECYNWKNIRQCKSGEVCMIHFEVGNLSIGCSDMPSCVAKAFTHPACDIAAHHPHQDCFVCCIDNSCLQQQMQTFSLNSATSKISTAAAIPKTSPIPIVTFPTANIIVSATTTPTSIQTTTPTTPTTTPRTPTTTPTTTPRMQLCPFCKDQASVNTCRAHLQTCDMSRQVCQISMKDLLFSSKCVDKDICEKKWTNDTLHHCAERAFSQHTDCTRCCKDDACINTTMAILEKERKNHAGSVPFCPHCKFATDSRICIQNTRPCSIPSGLQQGCHMMNHPDGSFSAGCAYDLPKCKYNIEVQNPHACHAAGMPTNATCHFCCNTTACVASSLNIGQATVKTTRHHLTALPVTSRPPPTSTAVSSTTSSCKDQDTRCHQFQTLYNICSVNSTSNGYQFIAQQCPSTCHSCGSFKGVPSSTSPLVSTREMTSTTTAQTTASMPSSTSPSVSTRQVTSTTTVQTTASRSASTSSILLPTTTSQVISTTTARRTPSIKCYECDSDEFTCEYDYHETQCYSPNDFCINHLKNNRDGTRSIIKRCGTLTECNRDWWLTYSDDDKCTRFNDNYVSTNSFECKYCCTTPLCNQNIKPDKSTLYAVQTTP